MTHTNVFGCSTKWQEKEALREAAERKMEASPVKVEAVDVAGLKKLRTDAGGHITLISFWATWCGSCVAEFSDLQDTFRASSVRDFDLATVSVNMPDEKQGVLRFLLKKHASSET